MKTNHDSNKRRRTRALVALVLVVLTLTGCATPRASMEVAAVSQQLQSSYKMAASDWQTTADSAWLEQRLGDPLSAEAAVQIALRNHPKMRALYAELGVAKGDLIDATRISNPTFDWNRSKPEGTNLSKLSFGLSQSLSDLLMRSARKKLATTALARSSAELSNDVQTTILQAETHYWAAVGAQHIQSARALSFEAARNSAELAQAFFDAGNISAKQLASEQAEAALASIEKLHADGAFTAARAELLLTLGLPDDAALRLPDTIPPVASDVEPLATLQARARLQRADLAAKREGVRAFEQYLQTSKRWRWFSDVHVGAERERETDGEKLRGFNFSLSLPIFNQGQGNLLRATSWLQRSEAELALMEQQVQSEVQLAHAALRLQMQLLATYQNALVPARAKLVDESQKQYNFMLIGAFDLILAKREEYQSYADAIGAARDYWIARAALKRAIGGELGEVALAQSIDAITATPAAALAAPANNARDFVCPMHPDVQSDQPGQCPICKMDLVPNKAKSEKSSKTPHEGHDHE